MYFSFGARTRRYFYAHPHTVPLAQPGFPPFSATAASSNGACQIQGCVFASQYRKSPGVWTKARLSCSSAVHLGPITTLPSRMFTARVWLPRIEVPRCLSCLRSSLPLCREPRPVAYSSVVLQCRTLNSLFTVQGKHASLPRPLESVRRPRCGKSRESRSLLPVRENKEV